MRKLTFEQVKSVDGFSSRTAAKMLGVGKSTITDARAAIRNGTLVEKPLNPRVLIFDIESKPLLAYVWGLWDQNIGLPMIKENGGMICFAAKWTDSPEIFYFSDFKDGHQGMLDAIWNLLSEADIVVGYNSDRYDIRRINNEFLLAGMTPPKPYKSVDLMKINKVRFDLPSRKLDYLVQQTGNGAKLDTGGFELWIGCMADDPESWKRMEEYNIHDVIVTEAAYFTLLPWQTNPIHFGMFTGDSHSCPYCGSLKLEAKGVNHSFVQTYDQFLCLECKGWSRSTARHATPIQTRATR